MDLSVFNYPAILTAAVASFFIGFMWHGPVFGKTWVALMKITPEQIEKGKETMAKKMPYYMLAAFLQQVVTAFIVTLFAYGLGMTDVAGALQLAMFAWLGFIATTLLNGVLWEERSVALYLFTVTYHLVNLMVISLIVTLWR